MSNVMVVSALRVGDEPRDQRQHDCRPYDNERDKLPRRVVLPS